MFPPPITSASSSPFARTSTSSVASSSIVRGVEAVLPRAHEGLAGELQQDAVEAHSTLATRLRTRRSRGARSRCSFRYCATVPVDSSARYHVCSVEHRFAEEALVELALDDLLADVLGLREHLFRLREDLALGVDELLRNFVPRAVRRAREGQVQREAARRSRVAALCAHDRADLVRRRVDVEGDRLAVRRLHALRADDLDVLAELRSERDPLVLERRRRRRRRTRCAAPSPRRRGSRRCSRRARSRSRSRRSRRRSSRTITPTLPSLVARSARFAADAIPFSRRSLTASSKSPSVSWSARLHSIIPALVASRSSFTIAAVMSVTRSPPRSASSSPSVGSTGAATASGRLRRSARLRPPPRRLPPARACGASLLAVPLRPRSSPGVTRCLPGLDPVGDRLDRRARTSESRRRSRG